MKTRALLVLALVVQGCNQSVETDDSEKQSLTAVFGKPGRVICFVQGARRAHCARIDHLAFEYKRLVDAPLFKRALEAIERANGQANFGKDVPEDASLVYCTGGVTTVNREMPGGSRSKLFTEVKAPELKELVTACEKAWEERLFKFADFGWPKGETSYGGAVTSAIAIMDKRFENCASSDYVLEANVGGKGPGSIMGSYLKALWRYFGPNGERGKLADGSKDYFSGKPLDVKKASSAAYRKGYEMAQSACKANPEAETCKRLVEPPSTTTSETTTSEADPVDPPPTTPGTSDPSGTCVDGLCGSGCEEQREAWESTKDRCEQVDWRSAECKELVYLLNGCKDPSQIWPEDGQYECRRKPTDEERQAQFEIWSCERGKRYAEANYIDGSVSITCGASADFTSTEIWYRIRVQKLCSYIKTEGGVCSSQIGAFNKEPATPPVPPGPGPQEIRGSAPRPENSSTSNR